MTKSESALEICEVFDKIAQLVIKLGAQPITRYPDCWEYDVDEHWKISLNGHTEPRQNSSGVTIPPFNCFVEFNGWPAGLFSATGGTIAAGKRANESEFISAIERAINRRIF